MRLPKILVLIIIIIHEALRLDAPCFSPSTIVKMRERVAGETAPSTQTLSPSCSRMLRSCRSTSLYCGKVRLAQLASPARIVFGAFQALSGSDFRERFQAHAYSVQGA